MSTVCTMAATTFPVTDSPAAAHTARNSHDASAAPYVAPSRPDEPRLSTQMTVADGGQRAQKIRASAYLHGWEAMTTFTARSQDLGTIRFARSPAWETLHAVRLFSDPRGRGYHRAWLAAAAARVRAQAIDLEPLLAVNPMRGSIPDFLTPPPLSPSPHVTDQLVQIRATPDGQVAEELRRCLDTL